MRIVCLGDTHYSSMRWRTKELKEQNHYFYSRIFETFFAQDADLYVSLGDLTHYGSRREFGSVYRLIHQYKKADQRFEAVVGNHDLLVQTKASYRQLTGSRLYWSEDHPEAKLIFMDTCRALHPGKSSSAIDFDQRTFVKKELQSAGEKLVVIFAHHAPERMRFYNEAGDYDPSLTMDQLLAEKKGAGIFINGHLHRDRYFTKGQWAFLQFNDVLDEPTIRVLDFKEGQVTMSTVSLDSPEMIHASRMIIRSLITFRREENPLEYAQVRRLALTTPEGIEFPNWNMDYVRTIDQPYISKKKRNHFRIR